MRDKKSIPYRKRGRLAQWLIRRFGKFLSTNPPFAKPHRTFAGQADLLISRGLTISDRPSAERFLQHVNYYRLSAYSRAYYKPGEPKETFIPGTTFDQIRSLYEFDCALRKLVVAAIEPIEVSIRTAIAYHLGFKYGPFGHSDPKNFGRHKLLTHHDWSENICRETSRSNEVFVRHFEQTYREFPVIPVWAAVEIMSFGALSKLFQLLKTEDQQHLAAPYEIHHDVLGSWLHTIVYVRNICAHHGRLWDRDFRLPLAIPRSDRNIDWKSKPRPKPNRLGSFLYAVNWMNNRSRFPHFEPAKWRADVQALLRKDNYGNPNFLFKIGLDTGWDTHPLWK